MISCSSLFSHSLAPSAVTHVTGPAPRADTPISSPAFPPPSLLPIFFFFLFWHFTIIGTSTLGARARPTHRVSRALKGDGGVRIRSLRHLVRTSCVRGCARACVCVCVCVYARVRACVFPPSGRVPGAPALQTGARASVCADVIARAAQAEKQICFFCFF